MRVNENCAVCLYDKQRQVTDDPAYLDEVKRIIENRSENDTAPYLVYLFGREYERRYGKRASYRDIKKRFNRLVLSMEDRIRKLIEADEDPLTTAMAYARIGNYIDYGALDHVDEETFLSLLQTKTMPEQEVRRHGQRKIRGGDYSLASQDTCAPSQASGVNKTLSSVYSTLHNAAVREQDKEAMDSMIRQCAEAEHFLLIADNCGEIVLDKLFLEQLKKRFPHLKITVLVRGGEVLNDATVEDAREAGIDQLADIVSNGTTVAGTVYEMISREAKEAMDRADVILAKGQGNYESLCRQGRHIFYSFLCKCDLFTGRFQVPKLTGILVEER